jgi:hypothetical protein
MRQARRLGFRRDGVGSVVLLAALASGGCSERNTELLPLVPSSPPGAQQPPSNGIPDAGPMHGWVSPERAVFWFDAASGVDFREGGVAVWVDQSPLRQHASQADPGLRPDAGVWVDGVTTVPEFKPTDTLQLPRLNFSIASGFTMLLLLRRLDASSGAPLALGRGGDGRAPLGFDVIEDEGLAVDIRGTKYEFYGLLPVGVPALLTLNALDGRAELRLDGVAADSWGFAPFEDERLENFVGRNFTGQIAFAALLAFGTEQQELERIEGKLAQAWGCCGN